MTTYTKDNDQLYRYLFKDRAVRGEWVRLNQTFNDTLNTHHYPQAVRNLLGEMIKTGVSQRQRSATNPCPCPFARRY